MNIHEGSKSMSTDNDYSLASWKFRGNIIASHTGDEIEMNATSEAKCKEEIHCVDEADAK
jgi:hypothetical protein